MDSEKVKEIKEALKWCNVDEDCNCCPYYEKNDCIKTLNNDILILVNEFESENEALQKGVKRLKKRYEESITKNADECVKKFCETTMYHEQEKLIRENQQLRDRIAELEKQMCRNEDLHTATEGLNDTVILKQFAERLKENFRKNNLESVIWFSNIGLVDKILKEFLK